MIQIQFQSFNKWGNRVPRPPGKLVALLLVLVCALIFTKLYRGYEGDFRPQGVHFWAQADRFSVARNYYDHGLNFFKPQTNYLEKSNGLTGIEFPALQYLSAVIAKPFGARQHLFLIYRILCFCILCIGLQFLRMTVKLHGGNGFQQLLIPVFFLLSPVLLFYGFNFLPDIPAFSLILISYYYFEKYRLGLGFHFLYSALAWGFGASLLKITSALFPMAFLCWFLINLFFPESRISRQLVLRVLLSFLLFSLISFGLNYYFTMYANEQYQSTVFLSTSRHINRSSDFQDIWENVVCWHREYFRETQYWILLAAFVVSFNPRTAQKGVLILKGILMMALICFILLMGKQLMHHDYYAICTLIPMALIFCLDGLMLLTRNCLGVLVFFYLVYNLEPHSLSQSKARQAEVYNLPCREIWDYRTYLVESSEWMDNHHIPKTDRVFVLYDFPLNTPLVYLDRKGMTLNHDKMKDQPLVTGWFQLLRPQWAVVPSQWEKEMQEDRPELLKQMKLEYRGKSVLIFRMIY